MFTHSFTSKILEILESAYPGKSEEILEKSPLLQYINLKTRSANRGSKSRSAFGNLYAIYVLVEDYVRGAYESKPGTYQASEGSRFTDLLQRVRQLPFGTKMQNHALNHRLNEEFRKYFPAIEFLPILRDVETARYWINENLLVVKFDGHDLNIAKSILLIVEAYIGAKRDAFEGFMSQCRLIQELAEEKPRDARLFVESLLQPSVDARIFEIMSFAILKAHYGGSTIFWGYARDLLNEEHLTLYKTGRTNANDGGIDFVMRPLGRFFQVTETLDVKKYFLDIDKVQRYPITFVVKSEDEPSVLREGIAAQARRVYRVEIIVNRYLDCIEEIIYIPILVSRFDEVVKGGKLAEVLDEIVLQSRVEFNYLDDDEAVDDDAAADA